MGYIFFISTIFPTNLITHGDSLSKHKHAVLLLETLPTLTKADGSMACIIDRLAFHAPSQQTKAGDSSRKQSHEQTTTKTRIAYGKTHLAREYAWIHGIT